MTKKEMLQALEASKARGAWARGVRNYAVDLVDGLEMSDGEQLPGREQLERELLNGARDWYEYSAGGCALVYDCDIAEALCSPSELKRCKGGERRPNCRESWVDCQARALFQAWRLIRRTAAAAATV